MANKKKMGMDTERAKQMVYVLWKYDGMTQTKIAKLYDVSQSTISATLKHVDMRIRKDPLYMMAVNELRQNKNCSIQTFIF